MLGVREAEASLLAGLRGLQACHPARPQAEYTLERFGNSHLECDCGLCKLFVQGNGKGKGKDKGKGKGKGKGKYLAWLNTRPRLQVRLLESGQAYDAWLQTDEGKAAHRLMMEAYRTRRQMPGRLA